MRIDLDGFAVVRDGSVKVALVFPGETAVEVNGSELWIDFNGLAVIGYSCVKIPFETPSKAAIAVS